MKWLFFILLMINVIFFTYHYLFSDKKEAGQNNVASLAHDGRVVLLSEFEKNDLHATTASVEPTLQSAANKKPETVLRESCFELDGLEDAVLAKKYLDVLINAGFVGSVTEKNTKVKAGYWVLTKRYETRAQALKVLRQMRKLSIDSYLIERGDKANAISVGLFKRKRHALERKRIVAEQGFEVMLKDHLRTKTLYKVDILFRGITKAPSPMVVLEGMGGKKEFIEKKCPEKRK